MLKGDETIVMKFGGTSVGSADSINSVESIIRMHLGRNPIVVVSALSGVTNGLLDLAHSAESGNGYLEGVRGMDERHRKVAEGLRIRYKLQAESRGLEKALRRIYKSGRATKKALDAVMSYGELMSSRLMAEYLSSKGIRSKAYAAYELGLLTDSNFGNADIMPSAMRLLHDSLHMPAGHLRIVTGFIGRDSDRNITTLGRGGSDYTASIIGAAIGAEEIEIWSDVNGIMSADPKIVRKARSIRSISYAEASELASLGAKSLHPRTILPAIKNGIPIKILNTFDPRHPGTRITKHSAEKRHVVSVALKNGVKCISIGVPEMSSNTLQSRVSEVLARHEIPPDMISASGPGIFISTACNCDIKKAGRDLSDLGRVKLFGECAKVSLVGEGMLSIPGVLRRLFSSIRGMHAIMTASSPTGMSQSIILRSSDSERAVRSIHSAFFR